MNDELRIDMTREPETDRVTFWLSGSLTVETYPRLELVFQKALGEGARHFRMDLGGLEEIHSCGFGVLIDLMGRVENLGGSMAFANLGDQAHRLFRLMGVMVQACE